MNYISTARMGDLFGALLVSLMALWLALVDSNPFRPCVSHYHMYHCHIYLALIFSLFYLFIIFIFTSIIFAYNWPMCIFAHVYFFYWLGWEIFRTHIVNLLN